MIVDFTVKNFRSIKSEQLLSLYAENKPKVHAGNITHHQDDLGILKTCAIYGANASGKTNLILAFDALAYLVCGSGDLKEGDPLSCYEPYLLSPSTEKASTGFELEFYVDGIRYLYSVEFNRYEILKEKLDFYPSSRAANLFQRTSPDGWKKVKFGEHYKGGTRQVPFFANNTYLAKAGNRPDTPEVVRKIYNFFRKNTFILKVNELMGIFDWNEDGNIVAVINTFLKKADLGIQKFDVENISVDDVRLPNELPDDLKNKLLAEMSKKEYFLHEGESGELVRFEKELESEGTTRLFKLLPFLIKVLHDGAVLLIDEIESSFHPHLAEIIVKLFNDPLVNQRNAQLIFTTHDLSLMSSDSMRKDQLYLTSKTVSEGTEFQCLENFDTSLKDHSPFAKWYGEGRLGGIPAIHYHDISEAIKEVF